MRDELLVAEASLKQHIPQLHPNYDGPGEALYLLELFWDVSKGRGTTGFGAAALGHVDLAAWCFTNRTTLTSLERDMIFALDVCYLTNTAPEASNGE